VNALLFDVHDVVLHGLFDERGDLGETLAVDVDYVVGGGEVLWGAGLHQGFDAVAEGFFFNEVTLGRFFGCCACRSIEASWLSGTEHRAAFGMACEVAKEGVGGGAEIKTVGVPADQLTAWLGSHCATAEGKDGAGAGGITEYLLEGLAFHPAEGRFAIFIEYFGNILALLFLNVGVKVDQAAFGEQSREDFPDAALAATHKAYQGDVFHIHFAVSVSRSHESR